MQKKLFVHIGGPKTGTSAIQSFVLRHREALIKLGVLYPKGGILKSAHHLIGAAIHPLRAKRLGTASREEALALAVSQIREEVAACQPRTLVISTEYLWGSLSSENVRRLLDPFKNDWQLHVVVYLRRQDLFAQSLYVQAVKTGTPLSFGEWVEGAVESNRGGFFFYDVLKSWRDCGLPVTIVPRIYEKQQIGADICIDFLNTIGSPIPDSLSSDSRIVNSAPDMGTTELLRMINATFKDKEATGALRSHVIKHSAQRALFAPLQYFSPTEAAAFMQHFDAENAKIAKEFLEREDGVLFRDPMPEGAATGKSGLDDHSLLLNLIGLLPALSGTPVIRAEIVAGKIPAADPEREKRLRKRARKKQTAGQGAAKPAS